ncbi:hypothetical protein FRC10_008228 [Ceratobasidium sp. 414]|nr:hypothetical protein FRC10_008228 [Ceratobasidium sp. 414]
MATLVDAPEHDLLSRWDSVSEVSFNASSTAEPDGLAPPIAPYPSPYRACTAAAFSDINRALAVRSLRESVRASSGSLAATRNVVQNSSCPRSPPSSFPARFASPAAEPQTAQPEPKPKSITRSRSMTTNLGPWAPLRCGRASAHLTEDEEKPVGVALNTEGRKSSGRTRSSGEARVGEGAPHPDMPTQGTRPAGKRRSTVHCIIM